MRGSRETIALTADAEMTATSVVSRAEVAAAFAKAVRAGLVKGDVARSAQRRFSEDWPDLARVSVTEALVERAERLAWDHGLRGYDAVQLASALTGQDRAAVERRSIPQQSQPDRNVGVCPWVSARPPPHLVCFKRYCSGWPVEPRCHPL